MARGRSLLVQVPYLTWFHLYSHHGFEQFECPLHSFLSASIIITLVHQKHGMVCLLISLFNSRKLSSIRCTNRTYYQPVEKMVLLKFLQRRQQCFLQISCFKMIYLFTRPYRCQESLSSPFQKHIILDLAMVYNFSLSFADSFTILLTVILVHKIQDLTVARL